MYKLLSLPSHRGWLSMTKIVFCCYADYTHNRRMKNNKQNTEGAIAQFIEFCKLIPAFLPSKIATVLKKDNPAS